MLRSATMKNTMDRHGNLPGFATPPRSPKIAVTSRDSLDDHDVTLPSSRQLVSESTVPLHLNGNGMVGQVMTSQSTLRSQNETPTSLSGQASLAVSYRSWVRISMGGVWTECVSYQG